MEPHSFTRKQLYELVWKEPIQVIAPKFGLSDRGLAKLCERHAIPTPPRGYWAKRQAGHKVPKAPLIELEGSRIKDTHTIARFAAVSPRNQTDTIDGAPDPLLAFWQEQRTEIGAIKVAPTLARPHRVIAAWLKEDDDNRRAHLRWGGTSLGVFRTTALERRRLRILSALYTALEARGIVVHCQHHGRIVELRHERDAVAFDLKEYIRQKRRPLNDDDIARGWSSHAKYRVDQIATGLLRGKVDAYLPKTIPTVWTEAEDRPFDEMLGEVAATVLTALAQAKVRREEREAAERKRWEDQQAAWRREEAAKAERARRQTLRDKARDWREAQTLRDYVAAVEAAIEGGDLDVSSDAFRSWSIWALACAEELDPIRATTALET